MSQLKISELSCRKALMNLDKSKCMNIIGGDSGGLYIVQLAFFYDSPGATVLQELNLDIG